MVKVWTLVSQTLPASPPTPCTIRPNGAATSLSLNSVAAAGVSEL